MSDNSINSAANDIKVPQAAPKRPKFAANLGQPVGADVKKRWGLLGLGMVAAMSAIATFMSSESAPSAPRAPQITAVDTTPKGLSGQQDWKSQTGADVQALKKGLSDSLAAQKELLARMESLRQEVAVSKGNAIVTNSNNRTSGRIDFTLPPPPEAPKFGNQPGPTLTPTAPMQAPASTGLAGPKDTMVSGTPLAAPAPIQRRAARAFLAAEGAVNPEAAAEGTLEKLVANEKAGFLPAGSFAAASLLSGVEAITGGTAQAQPQPIVIHVDANAILPNAGEYRIKGCHILASVYGDLSSERVFGRLATLTCVDSDNKLVLSEEVEGNLVDSDGKLGIRGKFQDRQSAKVGRALLAGFTEGMASAFGKAQSTTTLTGAGAAVTSLTGSAAKAAGYGGMDAAARQLADFYMKQAEATMPIIAVDAGRKVSVLFTKSKALRFEPVGNYKPQRERTVSMERK